MVVSIGAVSAPSQGVTYYERDGYYARDDPAHRNASAWAGKGAEALGIEGPVDPDTFKDVLAGKVPDGTGRRLGRKDRDGNVHHRPGRDITFSAPKSISLAALIGGDERIVAAHDDAVKRTLAWLERDVAQTRMKDPETGRMVRAGGQKIVAATFRHDTSRNLDPQLHTHAVIANMVLGGDGKWRTMANEKLYRRRKLVGMVYRAELARELTELGYRIEKTHADGRFEIAGVPRKVVEAFSTRRVEGAIRGPAFEGERLVSHGYTGAEKALAANYAPDDVVVFHRAYKRLGVEKGEERRVVAVDHANRTVVLEGRDGGTVRWEPDRVAGRGGAEVYRAEEIELRAGDRIRWTRNDARLGLVNSRTAEVVSVGKDRVAFRLEDGRWLELGRGDPQLRHLDHAWASTVHAFQGRTVDSVIAAMEANHPHLTTQKSFYVEISRARDRAELVTDDAARLREQLETVTGERVSALEGVGAMVERSPAREKARNRGRQERPGRSPRTENKARDREPAMAAEPQRIEHDFGL